MSTILVFNADGDIDHQRMDARQVEQKGFDITFEQAKVIWNKRNQDTKTGWWRPSRRS